MILAVGGNALIKTGMAAVRPGGKVMLFAQTQHGEASLRSRRGLHGREDPARLLLRLLRRFCDEVEELVFGGYRNGFDLTQLISHRFPLEEAVQAIEVASHPQGRLDEDYD